MRFDELGLENLERFDFSKQSGSFSFSFYFPLIFAFSMFFSLFRLLPPLAFPFELNIDIGDELYTYQLIFSGLHSSFAILHSYLCFPPLDCSTISTPIKILVNPMVALPTCHRGCTF